MGLRIMDPAYGRAITIGQQLEQRIVSPNHHPSEERDTETHRERETSDMEAVPHSFRPAADHLLTRPSQEDPTASSTERRWTPVSDASESLVSYFVDPAGYAVAAQSRSHASSESWGTSTDAGEIWRSEGIEGANYIHAHRGSASPNPEASHDQHRRLGSASARETPAFSSPYVATQLAYSWSLDGGCLKPGPGSPGLLAPQGRLSPVSHPAASSGVQTNGNYDMASIAVGNVGMEDGLLQGPYGPKVHPGPSQSPLSASMSYNDPRPSVSPTPRIQGLSPAKKVANAANPKRPKVRRKAHNAIEKRYRIRLNDKIAELRDSIPALRMHPAPGLGGNPGDLELGMGCEGGPVHKVNKANVLEKATEYIKSLEQSNRRLQAELRRALNLARNNHANGPIQHFPHQFPLEASMDSPHLTMGGSPSFDARTYLDPES